jgi:hypothetical protein
MKTRKIFSKNASYQKFEVLKVYPQRTVVRFQLFI